jgi:REP element-mobilizing transposase RayT
MSRVKQLSFLGSGFKKPSASFGGALLKNSHAKCRRPIETKLPLHLVLKSDKSLMRLPKNFGFVDRTVMDACKKHGIRIYEYANAGNHLHILIRVTNRRLWAAFIRELTGRIAYRLKFKWEQRPFTRIVGGWRKAFQGMKQYIEYNGMEASGYATREQVRFIRDFKEFWESSG